MALNSDTAGADQGGCVVYYRGPRIVVTSHYIENVEGRHRVRDLDLIGRVYVYAHPGRRVALILGAVELALAAPFAAAYGSAAFLCIGLVAASGLAFASLIDSRRNPRWMALRGIKGGRTITLFSSRNQQEFEQVRRAVIRAVEVNQPLRP